MRLKTLFVTCCVISCALAKPLDGEIDKEITAFHNQMARNRSNEELLKEGQSSYWKRQANKILQEKIQSKPNYNVAKNVILFMGDGMSIPTIAATRVYLGGEEMQLCFEKFPYTGLSKTYCVDHQVADSACSATAYLGGVKANLGTIGVSSAVKKNNCSAMNEIENHVFSLARQFQLKGKRSGLVTTTRVTHASPAGVYAHTASRHWENDKSVINSGEDPKKCEDIAHQLVYGETGENLNVIFGGGRKNFLPKGKLDKSNVKGVRLDGANLIEEWSQKHKNSQEIWNKQQLLELNNKTDFVLGLFEAGHMKYNLDRDPETDPSLEEMTEAAIKLLDKDEGFFLFVEGGRIDTAHHETWAQKALDETAEFSKAIQKAVELTNPEETLIVVTSDHAHTMSYSGYAQRGSNIFGYAGEGTDQLRYTIINYANGPGYKPMDDSGTHRYVPSEDDMNKLDFRFQTLAPTIQESHGGDDVAIFAKGPWSHLFTGVMEENVIPNLISYAACVNSNCDERRKFS